jgi:hypothetical protein
MELLKQKTDAAKARMFGLVDFLVPLGFGYVEQSRSLARHTVDGDFTFKFLLAKRNTPLFSLLWESEFDY